MDNQRVRLTLLVAFIFTIMFFWATNKDRPPVPPVTKDPSAPQANTSSGSGGSGTSASSPASASNSNPAPAVPAKFEVTAVPEVPVLPLENEFLRVELSAIGGSIRQVSLKKFYETPPPRGARPEDIDPALLVQLLPTTPKAIAPTLAFAEHGASDAENQLLATKPWTVSEERSDAGDRTVVFGFRTADGIEIEKRLTLKKDSYALDIELRTKKVDPTLPAAKIFRIRIGSGVKDTHRGQLSQDPSCVAMQDDGRGEIAVTVKHAKDLGTAMVTLERQGEARLPFAGVANHYFALLLTPADDAADQRTVGTNLSTFDAKDPEAVTTEVAVSMPLDESSAQRTHLRLYAGPKDPRLLEAQGLPRLVHLVEEDYGSWKSLRWVNKALLGGLRFFHGLVGNWGVAIMLLTLLIRAIVFPITRAQQVSMARYSAKMAVLKPKLDRLKAEMGDNPQKFAQEQMKLLREHQATPPLFGCLSSFITLPVFVGMWQSLRSAIEVRQAEFVGWIHDLSLPDALMTIGTIHINVLPILATSAFVLQVAMQPKPADPQAAQQQKMMMVMPIIFGVVFYNYAAGLSLYSLTSSSLSIFESKVIRKKWPVPTAASFQAVPVKKK